jgi:protein SCO1/2
MGLGMSAFAPPGPDRFLICTHASGGGPASTGDRQNRNPSGDISVTVPVKAMRTSQNSQGNTSGMGMQPKKPGGMGTIGREVKRARQWIVAAMAGLVGFAVVALAISLVVVPRFADGAAVGGPFTLVDDNDAPVTEKMLAGKPYAMYFGYTYCPEVCPTTLFDLSRWIKELGPDANKLNYVFVTVDPERDTPKLMHAYLSSFDRRIRGFTGTPKQIAKIATEYRVYYKKIPASDGSYVMDHSPVIYLMGSDGKFASAITYQEKDASALAQLRNVVGPAPSRTRSGTSILQILLHFAWWTM